MNTHNITQIYSSSLMFLNLDRILILLKGYFRPWLIKSTTKLMTKYINIKAILTNKNCGIVVCDAYPLPVRLEMSLNNYNIFH